MKALGYLQSNPSRTHPPPMLTMSSGCPLGVQKSSEIRVGVPGLAQSELPLLVSTPPPQLWHPEAGTPSPQRHEGPASGLSGSTHPAPPKERDPP